MQKKKRSKLNQNSPSASIALNTFFIIVCVACLLPIFLVVMISFSDESSIAQFGYSLIPKALSTRAYEYVLSDFKAILQGYGVSTFVTLTGTVCGVLFTAMIAYPLSRQDFKARKFFSLFVAFTMLFNGGLVPWYLVYVNMLGIKNSVVSLILPLLINGFNVIILRTFMSANIHPTLIEAAKIDGAGEYRIFFQLVLPLSITGLATIALIISLNYWNDWYNALLFIDDKKLYPLQYLMYKVNVSVDVLNTSNFIPDSAAGALSRLPNETARMAMSVLGIGPILLVYPFLQKFFVKGMTIGAVKG